MPEVAALDQRGESRSARPCQSDRSRISHAYNLRRLLQERLHRRTFDSQAHFTDFVFAGFSGLLILSAHMYSDLWFLSLFALVPFIYRLHRCGGAESARLGALLGLSVFAVAFADLLRIDPVGAIWRIALGTAAFAFIAWLCRLLGSKCGIGSAFLALAWIGIEIGTRWLGLSGGLILSTDSLGGVYHGIAVLLGCLTVSAGIVILNCIITTVIEQIIELAKAREEVSCNGEGRWDLSFDLGPFAQRCCLAYEGRGPPRLFCGVV